MRRPRRKTCRARRRWAVWAARSRSCGTRSSTGGSPLGRFGEAGHAGDGQLEPYLPLREVVDRLRRAAPRPGPRTAGVRKVEPPHRAIYGLRNGLAHQNAMPEDQESLRCSESTCRSWPRSCTRPLRWPTACLSSGRDGSTASARWCVGSVGRNYPNRRRSGTTTRSSWTRSRRAEWSCGCRTAGRWGFPRCWRSPRDRSWAFTTATTRRSRPAPTGVPGRCGIWSTWARGTSGGRTRRDSTGWSRAWRPGRCSGSSTRRSSPRGACPSACASGRWR